MSIALGVLGPIGGATATALDVVPPFPVEQEQVPDRAEPWPLPRPINWPADWDEPEQDRRRIVFLVDASGSMLRTMPFVRYELKRVIQVLHPEQQFQLIYFTGSGIGEMPGGDPDTRWIDATDENKEAAAQWLDSRETGFYAHGPASRHLLEALEWALFQEPAMVFFISDAPTGQGRYEVEQDAVLDVIATCNHPDHPARIHTIQFLTPDPLTECGLPATLERIAEETGGIYKFLTNRELNLR